MGGCEEPGGEQRAAPEQDEHRTKWELPPREGAAICGPKRGDCEPKSGGCANATHDARSQGLQLTETARPHRENGEACSGDEDQRHGNGEEPRLVGRAADDVEGEARQKQPQRDTKPAHDSDRLLCCHTSRIPRSKQ